MAFTFPTFTWEAAFGDDAFETAPTWTDISTYVRTATITKYRSNRLDKVVPSSVTLTLDNADERFDPLNSTGAYYGNPFLRVRIRGSVTWNAVTYRLITAYIESIAYTALRPSNAIATVNAKDALAIFAQIKLPADSYPAETTDARINRILDAIGWPAGATYRNLDVGQQVADPVTIEAGAKSALDALTEVGDSEIGAVFMSGDHKVTFHNRVHRFDTAGDYTAVATYGDGGGSEIDYESIVPVYDIQKVINQWSVTPAGGEAIVVSDATSIAAYGLRDDSRSPLTSDVNECQVQADYLLSYTKDPQVRFNSLDLEGSSKPDGAAKDTLYANQFGREFGDRVTAKYRPPTTGTAYTVSQDCWIEGIKHDITDTKVRTSFMLNPVDTTLANGNGYWLLADATYGLLGNTSRLAPV